MLSPWLYIYDTWSILQLIKVPTFNDKGLILFTEIKGERYGTL